MPAWELPWPPHSTNHQWNYGAGGVHLSPKVAAWRDEVIVIVRESGRQLPEGPLGLTLWLTPPDRVRRDVDGPAKGIIDAIFLAFGQDDYRVEELHVYRLAPKRPGSVLARVRTAANYRATEQVEREEMA